MMRTSLPRAIVRPLAKTHLRAPGFLHHVHTVGSNASLKQTSVIARHAKPLAVTSYRSQTALVRSYATGAVPSGAVYGTTADPEREQKAAQRAIKPEPEIVSSTSSVHPIFSEVAREDSESDVDMMAGVRHDIKVIEQTFALQDVPTEAYRVGLAGVLPYLATSTVTVACALEMNNNAHYGSGYVLDAFTAEHLLHILEPIQVGYGAVIISFLGAIHWGLEWAGYGGYQGYRRYAIGVIAPAIAWPTILFPVEYALITQFLAFNILYSVDSNATKKGWTPAWYSTYRFVLTAVVGASIVITLVGRGQITERIGELPTASQRIKELQQYHSIAGEPKENAPAEETLEEAIDEEGGEEEE